MGVVAMEIFPYFNRLLNVQLYLLVSIEIGLNNRAIAFGLILQKSEGVVVIPAFQPKGGRLNIR